jgi:hypothetical protein
LETGRKTMSNFMNNLNKVGMILQAGGGSLAGRDGMGVVREHQAEQERARRDAAINGLLGQTGIGGVQAALIEQLPVEDRVPTVLQMMAQMEAQRRSGGAAGAAAARQAAEQAAIMQAFEAFQGGGPQAAPQAASPYNTGVAADFIAPRAEPLSFGMPASAPSAMQLSMPAPPPVAPSAMPNAAPVMPLSFGETVTQPAPRSQMTPFDIARADMANLMSDRALALRGAPGSPTFKAWELAMSDAERRAEFFAPVVDERTAEMQNLEWRAQEAGLAPGTPEYEQFMLTGGASGGMGLRINPDGTVEFGTGLATPQNLPERQSVIALFGSMMNKTMPVINRLEQQFDPSNLQDNLAARAGWTGNYVRSEDARQYEAAGLAWAEAVLRIQTGAAATEPEVQRVFRTYFAQPGDSAATIQFKRELRDAYAISVSAASGGRFAPPGQGGEVPPNQTTQATAPSPTVAPTYDGIPTYNPETGQWE